MGMDRLFLTVVFSCLIASSAGAQSTTFTYDDLGRLKTVGHPNGRTTTYDNDAADNRTKKETTNPGSPGGGNVAPVCPVTSIITTGYYSYTLDAAGIGCTDANGNSMVFTSVSPGTVNGNGTATITGLQLYGSYSVTVNYTVSDGNGGSVNSTIYLIGDYGSGCSQGELCRSAQKKK